MGFSLFVGEMPALPLSFDLGIKMVSVSETIQQTRLKQEHKLEQTNTTTEEVLERIRDEMGVDLSDMATKEDLKWMATKEDLDRLSEATEKDLKGMATKEDLHLLGTVVIVGLLLSAATLISFVFFALAVWNKFLS